jgi:hypothetical protein
MPPLDNLPGRLVVLTRDQRKDKFLRDLGIRNPAALTIPGTDPNLDASVFADATSPIYANAVTIANGVSRATATGPALDDWAAREGTVRQPPAGAAGAVLASTSSSGSLVFAGDVLVHPSTGQRYAVRTTGTYQNGAEIPVGGIDVGPQTNRTAGTVLNWIAPRPGCNSTAIVATAADDSGLSGGSLLESDDELRARLDYIAAHPPASGNDSEYQEDVAKTPLLAVQQCFTYPAVKGPGSIGVAFALRPSQPGANRIPNPTQIAQALVFVSGLMPVDDGIYALTVLGVATTVVLKVLWAFGASAWADAPQWPPYFASPNLVSAAVPAGGTITASNFRLTSPSLTSTTGPSVGQSVGFFDLANGAFRRKKILTVTPISATQFDVTIDTTSGVSDASFVPALGAPCCPWSDSLATVIPAVQSYFDGLGPGEMFDNFFDPGLRQRRSPSSPQYWPNTITNRLLGGAAAPVPATGAAQNLPPAPTLFTLSTLRDVVLAEPSVPTNTPTGIPGVSVNLLTLGQLVVFPET